MAWVSAGEKMRAPAFLGNIIGGFLLGPGTWDLGLGTRDLMTRLLVCSFSGILTYLLWRLYADLACQQFHVARRGSKTQKWCNYPVSNQVSSLTSSIVFLLDWPPSIHISTIPTHPSCKCTCTPERPAQTGLRRGRRPIGRAYGYLCTYKYV